jgi:hypothetical protein
VRGVFASACVGTGDAGVLLNTVRAIRGSPVGAGDDDRSGGDDGGHRGDERGVVPSGLALSQTISTAQPALRSRSVARGLGSGGRCPGRWADNPRVGSRPPTRPAVAILATSILG